MQVSELPLVHHAESTSEIINMVYRGTVRTAMVLERQSPEAAEAIENAIIVGAENYKSGESYVLNWPAIMAVAKKA